MSSVRPCGIKSLIACDALGARWMYFLESTAPPHRAARLDAGRRLQVFVSTSQERRRPHVIALWAGDHADAKDGVSRRPRAFPVWILKPIPGFATDFKRRAPRGHASPGTERNVTRPVMGIFHRCSVFNCRCASFELLLSSSAPLPVAARHAAGLLSRIDSRVPARPPTPSQFQGPTLARGC